MPSPIKVFDHCRKSRNPIRGTGTQKLNQEYVYVQLHNVTSMEAFIQTNIWLEKWHGNIYTIWQEMNYNRLLNEICMYCFLCMDNMTA